ncbi:hypothetical protein [Phaeodactylibacter sp.]|uniref:hypothetical protein n=1 Tax=Phaeodactylibacter sp. TaxID=1940289 RepID=UPI0025FC8D5B|nr:hypothetical protein [Phaeodactylibacter sp.]MCI5091191.1 hypothetical protein [Phaeodactylibacter sp.]
MTVEEFEKHLKAEGGYYYRPNITVHYYDNKETGEGGFCGNYKGEETEDFDSLQALMDAHDWVEIPNSLDDESWPMCRKLPEKYEYGIWWEGIDIEITYKPKWVALYDHIEVRARQPLPITETGYRSIFLTETEITEAGGAVELVKYLLEKDADSTDWQQYKEESRQETLF